VTNSGASGSAVISAQTGYQINNSSASSGHYLRGDGTNYVDSALLYSDLTSFPSGCASGSAITALAATPTCTGFILNQTSLQSSSNFHISGTGNADTSFTAPSLDSASGALAIGNNNASAVNIGKTGSNILTTINGTALIKPTTGNDSATAFQVQNAAGSAALVVDSTPLNSLVANPSIEYSITGNWTSRGTGVSVSQTSAEHYIGSNSLSISTNGAAGDGAKQTLPTTLTGAATYALSFFVKRDATNANISASYSDDGNFGGGTEHSCMTNQAIFNVGWVRLSCTFTVGASPNASNALSIHNTGAATRTFYIDAVQIEPGSTSTGFKETGLSLNGLIASPVTLQNATNSSYAFQILKSSGANVLIADTINGRIGINTSSPSQALDVIGQINVSGGTGGPIIVGTPNNESGLRIGNSNRADIRFDDT